MSDKESQPDSGRPRPERIPRKDAGAGDKRIRPAVQPASQPSETPLRPAAQISASAEPARLQPAACEKDNGSSGHAAVAATGMVEANAVGKADAESRGGSFFFFTAVPSWLTSMILHVVVLLVFAMLTMPIILNERENELIMGNTERDVADLESFLEQPLETMEIDSLDSLDEPVLLDSSEMSEEQAIELPQAMETTPAHVSVQDPLGLNALSPNALLQTQVATNMSALDGRTEESRARMVREGGGTQGSEAAVAKALKWMAEHQLADGGWSLDHTKGLCQGRCKHPGSKAPARAGATGLALLPFLGAGNTHEEGGYKEVVSRGLQFLMRNMQVTGRRGRLVDEGNYYSHGLCTIAFCEAYAMSHDKELMAPAQLLVNETVFAQDPIGGGWRYAPQQPGDTSAVGWQLMALKSAHMAYLDVPRVTIRKTSLFLDSVQKEGGAKYGYQDPGNRRSTTSVGLLCRMYLGWNRDHEPLQRGIAYLTKNGPSKTDIYLNYYATQIMRHYGGEEWERWNEKMRDYLVDTQSLKGHEEGSWMFESGTHHIEAGGRLYCTSLATMILEVYYRHLPLYKDDATEDDFPL